MKKSIAIKKKIFLNSVFVLLFIALVFFLGGFLLGKSTYTKNYSQSTNNILNESYIYSLKFPKLKSEILAGYDDSYKVPNTVIYTSNAFRFNYPINYEVSIDSTQAIVLNKAIPCVVFGIKQVCQATIKILSIRPNLPITLHNWFVQEDLTYFMNNGKVNEAYMQQVMKTINVDGEEALYNSDVGDPGHFDNNVIFLHKNEAYDISINSYGVTGAAAVFRQLISSFKFSQ